MKAIQQKSMVFALIVLQFVVACQSKTRIYEKIEPAHIEHIAGSELSQLTLTQKAVERTDIQTAPVREEGLEANEGKSQLVVPYSALIYDAHGHVWVYTNSEPLKFDRHEVKVDFIKGDKAFLLEGPPAGTQVVRVGAAELYGTEYDVGH